MRYARHLLWCAAWTGDDHLRNDLSVRCTRADTNIQFERVKDMHDEVEGREREDAGSIVSEPLNARTF